MSAEIEKEIQLEIAHVLFIDKAFDRTRLRENIAMPATIAASASSAAVVAAQRIRALCFFRAWNFFGSCGLPT